MPDTLASTPRQDGFRMPGEFEPHAGCWMLWPERPDNWRMDARPAQHAFAAVARAIAQFEQVAVGISPQQFPNAYRLLARSRAFQRGYLRIAKMAYNDAWMRDVGPTFVADDKGNLRGVNWEFNAWGGHHGGLYSPWDQDQRVARRVLAMEGLDGYKAQLVMEGGSFHIDGEGTLLATEECLLNLNRNPHLTRAEIEANLKEYLDVEQIVWLGKGVYLDETDGHVDNLCCFVRPGVVALTWTDDKTDPQHAISQDAYERLNAATDARGRKFEIHKLHQPGPLIMTKEESQGVQAAEGIWPRRAGNRMAGSYVNFYIANRGVVMPIFNDPHDQAAFETLQKLFPERKVIGVPTREILLGGGNIHCITQQRPAGAPRAKGEGP